MTIEQKNKCDAIIHSAAVEAETSGTWEAGEQFPRYDNKGLELLEMEMMVSLGKVFGLQLAEDEAICLLREKYGPSAAESILPLFLSGIFCYEMSKSMMRASMLVESLGWMLVEDFSQRADAQLTA